MTDQQPTVTELERSHLRHRLIEIEREIAINLRKISEVEEGFAHMTLLRKRIVLEPETFAIHLQQCEHCQNKFNSQKIVVHC